MIFACMYLGWIFCFMALSPGLRPRAPGPAWTLRSRAYGRRGPGGTGPSRRPARTECDPCRRRRSRRAAPLCRADVRGSFPRRRARPRTPSRPAAGRHCLVRCGSNPRLSCEPSLCLDSRYAERGLFLSMAARLARPGLVLVLEHADLRSSSVAHDLRDHLGVAQQRGPRADRVAVGYEQDLVERHALAGLAGAAIDGDLRALLDPVALSAAADDRVHRRSLILSEQKKSPRLTRDVTKSIADGRPCDGRPPSRRLCRGGRPPPPGGAPQPQPGKDGREERREGP